jgi:hypothetical protein
MKNFIVVEKDGFHGVRRSDGTFLLPLDNKKITHYCDAYFDVESEDGRYVLDADGHILFDFCNHSLKNE